MSNGEEQGEFSSIEQAPANAIESAILQGQGEKFTEGDVVETRNEGMEYPSPFTLKVTGPRKKSVEKIHQNRSKRAQDVDEQQNAPVTTDEEKWIENKNRYDYPGVDTVPDSKRKARAEQAASRAQEMGVLDKVEQKGHAKSGLQGTFSYKGRKKYGKEQNAIRIQQNASDPGKALAHETAHSFDFGVGDRRGFSIGGELLGLEDDSVSEQEERELFDEAKELSKRARGGFGSNRDYRTRFEELTADALGQAIIQPRATKREAPRIFDRLENIAEREGFADVLPEPMGADAERQGFLD